MYVYIRWWNDFKLTLVQNKFDNDLHTCILVTLYFSAGYMFYTFGGVLAYLNCFFFVCQIVPSVLYMNFSNGPG